MRTSLSPFLAMSRARINTLHQPTSLTSHSYSHASLPGIFISSNLFGSIFQIASLPVVILAPLGAVSLLWNAFFARLILGDVFSPWMLLSTLCIAGGAVLIAVFGIVPEPNHSLEDLLELFSRPAFVVYFSLLDRKSTRLNSSHSGESRMPSSA